MIHDVVIYKANETNFNHEGLGVLIDFVEDVEVTENNRGFFELKFTYSLNGKLAQNIKEEAYIKTVANERQEEPLIFRIYQCEPDYIERLIYVRARLKIIDDMMNSVHKSIVFPKSFGITPIIEGLFKNAVPSLNYRLSGSVNNLHDISHEDDTVYEHLFQENGLFVMNDITPLYTPLGMTINTTRGNKRVDTITEQDFINKFKIIRERKNMITAIIPWTVTKRDEFVANEEDARRSYRDTLEEKVYGEIIVSPKVASHGYPFIAKFMEFKNEVTREWEENNRTMREYKYQSVEDLNKATQNFFTENKGIDEYSIEASIETLGLHMDYMKRLSSLGLYDEVEFYLEEHDLKIVLAVSEVTYSPSLDMNLALTFQSNTSTLSKAGQRINANAPSERDLQNLIERERLKEIVRNYIDKADGTRTYWVSELPDPATAGEQDIAFLETAEGKSIWVLINGVWVEKLPLNFEERLRDELERVDTQTKAMEVAIREVDQTTNSLVRKITNVENIQLEGIQRISTLETEAGQLPSKIASIVSGYDFVNQNYVDTKLNEETGEIVRKLAYVENLAKASDRNFFFVRDLDNRITGTTFKIVTLKLSPETTYTVSTEFPKSASATYKVFAARTPISVSHASNGVGQGYPRTITTGPDGKLDIAFTGSDLENIKAMAVGSRIMVNFGDVTKDWQMAPEDTSSEESFRLLQAEYAESVEGLKVKLSEVESTNNTLSEKVTTLNVSAGVIQQTISGIKTNPRGTISGYNELINKVDGVVQTIGDSESVARLVMGSNVYQQEISNLNKISTRNLVRDSGNFRAWLPYARNIITANQTTLKGDPAWAIRGAGMSSLHPNPLLIQRGFALTTQEGTEWLTAHFLVRNDLTNGLPLEFKMNNIDAPGVRVESGETVRVVFSGKHPVGGTLTLMVISPNNLYANADFTIGPIMVTRSRQVVDHMYAPEDAENEMKVIRNQVTQTSTSWAVRNLTEQGDIISQMNLIDDLVKIQARFIHLSGESLIEKGVIKSAHIGDAQIGTAHIGTIDAAVARIINIDAGNITSGYISSDRILARSIGVDKITGLTSEFIRSLWQGDGRVVRIDNRGFLIFEIDGKNFVNIGSNGLQFSSDTGNNAVVKNIKSTEYGLNDKNVVLLASRRGNHIGLGYESAEGSNVFIRSLSVDPYSGFLKLHKELATNGQWITAGGTAQGERIRFVDDGGVLSIYRYGGGGLRLQNGDFSYYNALKGWVSFNKLEARVAQLERY